MVLWSIFWSSVFSIISVYWIRSNEPARYIPIKVFGNPVRTAAEKSKVISTLESLPFQELPFRINAIGL